METRRKIEEAINSFREKRKQSIAFDLEAQEKEKVEKQLSEACAWRLNDMSASVLNLSTNLASKNKQKQHEAVEVQKDSTMEEFDQYVLYNELRKGTTEIDHVTCGAPEIENTVRHSVDIGNQNSSNAEITEDVRDDGISCQKDDVGPENVHKEHSGSEKVLCSEECNEDGNNSDEEILSDDDLISDNPDEEYLFPTPDEISNAKTPVVGMVFSSLEEAVRFVNVYGQLAGFSMIKGRNYKQKKITLQCNKSRKTVSKTIVGQRKRRRNAIGRTNCQMNVTVKLVETKWHIISCVMDHNHELVSSPSLTKFFLSHRTMSEEEMMLSKLLQEIRVKPQRIMTIFRRLKGSFRNIMFGKKKLDNLKQADRKNKKNSDINCTLKYIEKLQLQKPGFCCKMEVDTEGAVRSIFWTDGRSRLDYKLFGDVICFDTTYSTNKCNMQFAPIIGINGHGKTVVFGWALLKDQKSKTFEWLFESFVEVMEGKKPSLILTDQDVAMKNAISVIFPDAWHRFCIWHVLKCLRENMSAYMAEREGMEDAIVSLIMESLTEIEFEARWAEMLTKYNGHNHEHLKRMWAGRKCLYQLISKGASAPSHRRLGGARVSTPTSRTISRGKTQ